jgi:hypothetical protein
MTENAAPDQMSSAPAEDVRSDVLRRAAMKAHLEAQQLMDLRKDIAQKLKPSDGPFNAGDRVFDWDQDRTKIKSGHWIRGKVIAQNGPMVTIDTGRMVVRVTQSKVKKDFDEWHDVSVPVKDEDDVPLRDLAASAQWTIGPSALAEEVFWQATTKGKFNFLALFSGSAHLSAACAF